MRVMNYRLTLHGDYFITNNPEATDQDDLSISAPAIQMTAEKVEGGNLEAFLDLFETINAGEENPDFEENWKAALLGKPSNWKLANVRIHKRWLWLDFVNEALYDQYYRTDLGERDSLPYYSESVLFQPKKEDPSPSIQLRFDVSLPNSCGVSTTKLKMTQSRTIVTEPYNNGERELVFGPPPSFPDEQHSVSVQERTW